MKQIQLKNIFFVIAAGLMIIISCEPASQPPQQQKSTQQQAATMQEESSAQTEAQAATWPFNVESELPRDKVGLPPAENILARNFILIFDGSGSMEGDKLDTAKKAVKTWSSTVPVDANLGLVAFHRGGWTTLPLATKNRAAFINAIAGIDAGGGTPLSEASKRSFTMLSSMGLQQLGYGEYNMVIVTDGEASNASSLRDRIEYIVDKSRSPIQIRTIGFQIGNNHSLNQPGVTHYVSADNEAQLSQGLKDVLAEAASFDVSDFQ